MLILIREEFIAFLLEIYIIFFGMSLLDLFECNSFECDSFEDIVETLLI